MPSRCCVVVALAVLMIVGPATFAHAAKGPPIEVIQCGQRVPGGRLAVLTGDLACATDVGIVLEAGATFDLQGFTLSGPAIAVACLRRSEARPQRDAGARCEVRNGTITEIRGMAIFGSRVTARNLMVDGYGGTGISGETRVDVFDSFFLNATGGLQGMTVTVTRSTLVNTTVNAWRARLTSTSITNNDRFGVTALSAILVDSHVENNGLSSECGPSTLCADIAADHRPKLDATSTCGTSLGPYGRESWGVCALD